MYPKTLFRPGGPEIFYGRHYERCIVQNEDEEREKLASNWLLRPLEAPEPEPEPVKPEKSAKPAKPKKRSEKRPARKR